MWARLHRIKFWRFLVPFAKVIYVGRRGFISPEWNSALPQSSVSACCIRLDMPADQKQPAMRLVTAKITLVRRRWCNFMQCRATSKRRSNGYLAGSAGKDAVRMLWYSQHGERLFPADINVRVECRRPACALRRGQADQKPFATISVAQHRSS